MKMIKGNNFSKEEKYKLYRTVHAILHPTISKKNISNYRVVLEEELLPVQVFYPLKVTDMKKVIIAIPGDGNVSGCYGKYDEIYKNMAVSVDALIIAVDYFNKPIKFPTSLNKIYKIVTYLYDEFVKNGIKEENITFLGDSIGCVIMGELLLKMKKKRDVLNKSIWLYPVCRTDYSKYEWNDKYLSSNYNLDKKITNYLAKYFAKCKKKDKSLINFTKEDLTGNSFVISGDMDLLIDDSKTFSENIGADFLDLKYLNHGFLGNESEDELVEVYSKINDFVKL